MKKFNPVIFREYDIRGTVDVDLSDDFAYWLGRAYATLALEHGAKQVAVGRDCRLSSESYAQALAKGITEGGINVQLTGMGPTPQVYFAIYHRNLDGGIQVTGSHNPSDMNGFKLCLGKHTLSGAEIQDLYSRVQRVLNEPKSKITGSITDQPIQNEYIDMLIGNSSSHIGERKVKIVADAGNGVGGLVGPKVLRALGAEVVELFCDPDGRFPNHHPDPTVPKNLVHLINKVKETKADFGVGWDGDADRIGVVDEKGNIIYGDMLLLIYARELLNTIKSPTVIGDVKCSALLFADLAKKGANPIMWKTGHSLIKSKLKETHAELAGEMSGHIFFANRYFGFDDAVYATCRFLEVVTNTNKPVSEFLSDLPRMVSTPEMRVDCPEELKFKIVEKAKTSFNEYKIDTTDGIRISFPKGWGLVRASNTQPVLVMRFEAENEEDLKKYEAIVRERIG